MLHHTGNTKKAFSIASSLVNTNGKLGIYVYENAEDIGVNCWLVNYFSIDAVQTVFDLTVYAGQSYYFVISTYPSPQSIAYSLDI